MSQKTNITISNNVIIPNNLSQITFGNENIISDYFIWTFIGFFVIFGLILNGLFINILSRIRGNGTLYLLLQLSICDIITLLTCGIELFYMNYQKWIIQSDLCPIYLGFESFASTAIIYFAIVLNFHGISTFNLTIKTLDREIRLQDELNADNDNTITDSLVLHQHQQQQQQQQQQLLQSNNDGYEIAITDLYPEQLEEEQHLQQRSLTIDYSQKKLYVSVIIPIIMIWCLTASVSMPLFIFGKILPNSENPKFCGIINFNNSNNYLMQLLIILIKIIIPIVCLMWTSICVICKLFRGQLKIEQHCGLNENAIIILRLALSISIVILIFSVQKLFGSLLYEILSPPFKQFKYPKFPPISGILFSMVYYVAASLRPIIYFYFDKKLYEELKFCCFMKPADL